MPRGTASTRNWALGSQQILHLYGDTTLEFPESAEYVKRFKKEHPKRWLLRLKIKIKTLMNSANSLDRHRESCGGVVLFLKLEQSRERFKRCSKIKRESLLSMVSVEGNPIHETNMIVNQIVRKSQFREPLLPSLTGWTLMCGCIC